MDSDFTEEGLVRVNLIPDSEYESTFESTEWDSDSDDDYSSTSESASLDSNSDHEHELHVPPTGDWDQYHSPSQSEYRLPVPQLILPPTGWDWNPDDDESQPPSHSNHEYQLPYPPTGWDLDSSDDYEPRPPSFHRVCRCLPFSQYKNSHLETGNKIIMPPSYLGEIISLGLEFPLFFKIENSSSRVTSHCGVLEFDGTEGCIFVPEWMMNHLKLKEGDYLIISSALLLPGSYMKLQPHATAFTQVSDPKAVLEKTLRDFACLSRGDTFMIRYNERDFHFDVLEVAPADAISLVETDCEVEFAPPLDYKEPEPEPEPVKVEGKEEEDAKEFKPFTGTARRINGNPVTVRATMPEEIKMSTKEAGKEKFKPFTGRSYTLGSS